MSKVPVQCILAVHLTCAVTVSKKSANYLIYAATVFDFCELFIYVFSYSFLAF